MSEVGEFERECWSARVTEAKLAVASFCVWGAFFPVSVFFFRAIFAIHSSLSGRPLHMSIKEGVRLCLLFFAFWLMFHDLRAMEVCLAIQKFGICSWWPGRGAGRA